MEKGYWDTHDAFRPMAQKPTTKSHNLNEKLIML